VKSSAILLVILSPIKGKKARILFNAARRYSFQYPLEGDKCLGGLFMLAALKALIVFLILTPLKGVLKRVTNILK
jgi:hypothetical protein